MPKLTGTAISKRDDRRHQRAVDHDQATVRIHHRIPLGAGQKAQAVLVDRRPRTDDQRQDDAYQQGQGQERCSTGQQRKNGVGPGGLYASWRRIRHR